MSILQVLLDIHLGYYVPKFQLDTFTGFRITATLVAHPVTPIYGFHRCTASALRASAVASADSHAVLATSSAFNLYRMTYESKNFQK